MKDISLKDIRIELSEICADLRDDKMDYKKAAEIRNMLAVIVDTYKVQNEFFKSLPTEVKTVIGLDFINNMTGSERVADADKTIEQKNPVKLSDFYDDEMKSILNRS